jgi:NTP pyrophosphatase (non-canonical NTP hydrolase)
LLQKRLANETPVTSALQSDPRRQFMSDENITLREQTRRDRELKRRAEKYLFYLGEENKRACSPTWPFVQNFSLIMEKKLSENRHKGDSEGWRSMPRHVLLKYLVQEITELQEALMSKQFDPEAVSREAADVANFAMMISDNYGNT